MKDIISDRPIVVEYVKSPLEKIIEKLKEIEKQVEPSIAIHVDDVIRLVQKFAQELEHEKANAIIQIVSNCHSMERIEFYRGKIEAFKKLQRDFNAE